MAARVWKISATFEVLISLNSSFLSFLHILIYVLKVDYYLSILNVWTSCESKITPSTLLSKWFFTNRLKYEKANSLKLIQVIHWYSLTEFGAAFRLSSQVFTKIQKAWCLTFDVGFPANFPINLKWNWQNIKQNLFALKTSQLSFEILNCERNPSKFGGTRLLVSRGKGLKSLKIS